MTKEFYDTLSQATKALSEQGYTLNFNLAEEGIESKAQKANWHADKLKVDKFFRFEGMTNPGDNTILYAITTDDGQKGLLTDAYGADASLSKSMLEKLKITHGG